MNICFVAHYAYRAMSGIGDGHIGGVERQTSLMAKWLAKRGHRVTVIVWDEGQPDQSVVERVKVLKICRRDAGIPGIRFFVPRWSSLLRALRHADADIYYQNCAEYITGQVALWVRSRRRKFIYSVASDPECDPQLDILDSIRERILYRLGLKMADAVIAQTTRQQHQLQSGFDVNATVLPMPCAKPQRSDQSKKKRLRTKVLWVGRIDRIKRAEIILRVARDCPDIEFDIVGPSGSDERYVVEVRNQAMQQANVNWHGAVDFADNAYYYQQATIFCCTSEFEGFPNTFLEAWSYGVPVISTVDPDNVITRRNLGVAVNDPGEIGTSLCELAANTEKISEMSEAARNYFTEEHEQDAAMIRFEALFKAVLKDQQHVVSGRTVNRS